MNYWIATSAAEPPDVFTCLCGMVVDESEKATCELIDEDMCDTCHKIECLNRNLCMEAGNFSG